MHGRWERCFIGEGWENIPSWPWDRCPPSSLLRGAAPMLHMRALKALILGEKVPPSRVPQLPTSAETDVGALPRGAGCRHDGQQSPGRCGKCRSSGLPLQTQGDMKSCPPILCIFSCILEGHLVSSLVLRGFSTIARCFWVVSIH